MSESKRYLIHGRVQGVSFRANTCRKAQELGLTGWVRNLADGRVEAEATGDAAVLDSFERWLWQGPEFARVTEVESHPTEAPERGAQKDFIVR